MKKAIRQEIISKRKKLTPEEVLEKSNRIFNNLKTLPLYKNAESVMLYMDFNNEVKTKFILDDLIKNKMTAVIPISVPRSLNMILSQVINPEIELARSSYGILEPKPEYIREIDAKNLDLVIVPGVAFDFEGYRIGYGGGYYDYFFGNAGEGIPSVAIAFDLQLIGEAPRDTYDRPVDFIVTESRIIECQRTK